MLSKFEKKLTNDAFKSVDDASKCEMKQEFLSQGHLSNFKVRQAMNLINRVKYGIFGHSGRTHGRNIPDADLILVMTCCYSLSWCNFDFGKRVKLGVSDYFVENTWKNGLKFGTLIYSDYLQILLDLSDDVFCFCFTSLNIILTWLYWLNIVFPGIFLRTPWTNGVKFRHTEVYWPPSNLLFLGHGLFIIIILAQLY